MVITQTQFNAAMTEINTSFMALNASVVSLTRRVDALELAKAAKPTTTKDKK